MIRHIYQKRAGKPRVPIREVCHTACTRKNTNPMVYWWKKRAAAEIFILRQLHFLFVFLFVHPGNPIYGFLLCLSVNKATDNQMPISGPDFSLSANSLDSNGLFINIQSHEQMQRKVDHIDNLNIWKQLRIEFIDSCKTLGEKVQTVFFTRTNALLSTLFRVGRNNSSMFCFYFIANDIYCWQILLHFQSQLYQDVFVIPLIALGQIEKARVITGQA